MKWTLDRQLFTGLALLLFLFNLTLLNDFVSIWAGAETVMANQILEEEARHPISWLYGQFAQANPFNLVAFRLASILSVVFCIILSIWLVYKLLGQEFSLLFGLSLVGNYFFFGFTKVASADGFSLLFQTIGILAMIRFMKQPQLIWRMLTYLGIALSVWIHPITGILLFLLLPSLYYLFHKDGKKLWGLNPWSIVLLMLLLLYFSNQLNWYNEISYLGWGQSSFPKFLLLLGIGFLPLLGFLFAGLQASIKNIKKKEEYSLLFLPWFGVALLTQSPSIGVVIALIIAKHIGDYTLKNYPFKNTVRIYNVIHLIAFFFLASTLMLGGFFVFRGVGFRSALSFSFVYWALSFILVIGLYGVNRRLLYAGSFMICLLTTSLFSLRVFPLLNQQRLVNQLLTQIEMDKRAPSKVLYTATSPEQQDNVQLYLGNLSKIETVGKDLTDANGPQLKLEETNIRDTTAINGWRDDWTRAFFKLKYE